MEVLIDFQKLALSLATAVVHFHRKTSNLSEYSAKDICDTLIKGSSTRSSSFVLVESDLEAAFGNITLRKILKAIFFENLPFFPFFSSFNLIKHFSQSFIAEYRFDIV